MFCGDALVFRIRAAGQKTTMNLRMKGFYPTVEHLRKAGEFANVAHGQARIAQSSGGAAGGNKIKPRVENQTCEINKASFVTDGKKGETARHDEGATPVG